MSKVNIRDSVRRTEDIRFVSGQGSYIDDMNVDGQLIGVFVRSPHAHAAINGFDKADALALDGVVDVITGVDWAELGFGVIPTNSAVKENADGTAIAVPERPCLAATRVRFVGEPVAMVVAETMDAAREARELRVAVAPRDARGQFGRQRIALGQELPRRRGGLGDRRLEPLGALGVVHVTFFLVRGPDQQLPIALAREDVLRRLFHTFIQAEHRVLDRPHFVEH